MLTRFVTDNNEWSGITGVLVTYENVLYVSTVSVTPHSPIHLFFLNKFHSPSVKNITNPLLKHEREKCWSGKLGSVFGIKSLLVRMSN